MNPRLPLSLLAVALATLVGCSSGDGGAGPVGSSAGTESADADAAGQGGSGAAPGDGGGAGQGVGTGAQAGDPTPADAVPFASPDPDGTSVVSRLGYREATALADALVSADYLDLFFDVENDLFAPMIGSEEFFATAYEDRRADCPDGGVAVLTTDAAAFGPVDVAFEDCAIEGRVLNGHYVREAVPNAFGSGSSLVLAATLDGLSVDAGEAGSFLVTGTSAREDGVSGGCPALPGEFFAHEDAVASAVVELGGRTFEVRDARSSERLRHDQPGAFGDGPDRCERLIESLAFEATATVRGEAFGAGDAALARGGEIVRDSPAGESSQASATLTAAFADGSGVAVTLADDAAGEARFDVTADGTASSFTDVYRFGAR